MALPRKFVVLGTTRELVTQVLLALHADAEADCIAVCAPSSDAWPRTFSTLATGMLEADFAGRDDGLVIAYVNRLAAASPDLVVIPADCDGSRLINRLCGEKNAQLNEQMSAQPDERLAARVAPTPDASMLDCFDDKWRFHQFCIEHGFNVPSALLLRSKRELDFALIAAELGLPFVVKPTNTQASRGVHVIADREDWGRTILDNPEYRFAPLIVQRHVPGVDLGVNLLAIRGDVRALAVQRRDPPQHADSRINFIENAWLQDLACALCRASGYHGVMNIDCRVEEGTGKIYLFESNPRYWRSLSASVWCGLNFVAESLGPPAALDKNHILAAGSADTFYHPLFRPALWPQALFGRVAHRRRMVRWMMRDMDTLGEQLRARAEWYWSKLLRPIRLPTAPPPSARRRDSA
ncbi:ATP-grasp domain-containing protein [Lacisediminimonas profundi]|uniref:ATP-grasp domain-containing protein n=1 Tax=Lacisediminimonas profundi TaxID=2603856 RepID=UPI00124AFAC9|nr:ATP-grasp domain-containing protein [Lacisediminimonas profundi]